MALPDVQLTVQDGALGIAPAIPTNTHVKLGVCSGGVVGTLYSFSDPTLMQATLGQGPLVEAAAHALQVAGGPIFLMPVNPSAFGFLGTITSLLQSGSTGTLAGGLTNPSVITLKCVVAGTLGTAQFTVQLGSGPVSAPILSAASWSSTGFLVPGTLTVLTFTAGSYVAGGTPDIYTSSVTSTTVAHTQGAGPVAPTLQASPLDNYQVQVKIILGGAPGTATFQYSLDNGNTFSPTITVPSGTLYAINTGAMPSGIFLTFGGTYVAGDLFTFNAVTAGYSTTDASNGMTTLLGLPNQWFMVHMVGTPASAAAASSLASTMDTQMSTAATAFRYAHAVVECPTLGTIVVSGSAAIADVADTDSTLTTQFASFTSLRVSVAAGDCDLTSQITGRIVRRQAAWPYTARLSLISPGEDPGRVARGALPSVKKLYRDEQATPALDGQRFVTLRTFVGIAGFYVTNGWTMALSTSDFAKIANRRVMDLACTITRSALLKYLNSSVRVNATTGFILEQDAKTIESDVNGQLLANVVNTSPPNASASSVQLSRTQNILSTSTEPVTVRVTPLGYLKTLSVNIGFANPALS